MQKEINLVLVMQADLKIKKAELKKRQGYLESAITNDLDMSTFERNLIGDLIVTNDLKAEIKLLDHYINLANMFSN